MLFPFPFPSPPSASCLFVVGSFCRSSTHCNEFKLLHTFACIGSCKKAATKARNKWRANFFSQLPVVPPPSLPLLVSLRHCATRQPWRVPVSRDGYTAFWDKRRLGTCIKYEACRPNGLPVCVCATPPCTCVSGNCWLCLPTVYQKMKQKSNGSAKSSSQKYASVFVFYSYNNKSTVAASSGTVTAKTTAAVAVSRPPLLLFPSSWLLLSFNIVMRNIFCPPL